MASSQPVRTALRPFRHSKLLSTPSTSSAHQLCHSCQRLTTNGTSHRIQPRYFSSSRTSRFPAGIEERHRRQFVDYNPKTKDPSHAQPGTRSRMQTVPAMDLPDDFGLVPETFVKPTAWSKAEATGGKKLAPSWIGEPRKRVRMEWYWVKNRVLGFVATYVYCRWSSQAPKLKLGMGERRKFARKLHQALYTALAEGNAPLIRTITSTSLRENLLTQLSRRAPSTPLQHWTLQSYTGLPAPSFLPWPLPTLLPYTSIRVISDRCVALPLGKNSGVRQIVVRISSRQKLQRDDGETKEWKGTEYVVLQKMRYEGREFATENEFGGWKVWGTTEETGWDEFEGKLEKQKESGKDERLGFMERVRSMMPSVF